MAVVAAFPRYWLSAFLADFGDGVRLAAFPLLAAGVTQSAVAVAAVTAVQGLPWLLLGLGAGVVVDRSDRRQLMVAVDVCRAVIIGLLAAAVLLHAVGLTLIYLTAFVTGVGSALRDTAAETSVPRLVPAADLDRANGRLIAGQIVGNELAGPAVGGWLFGVAAALPFAVNAGALGIAVLLLLTLPSVFQPLPDAGGGGTSMWQELRDGVDWLRRDARIRTLVVACGVICAVDAAWFAVLVLYVEQVLHQPDLTYGVLLAAGAIGGVAAGAAAARITPHVNPGWYVVAMAASQLGLGLTTSAVAGGVFLAASSAAFALFNVAAVTMRQRLVPPAMLGRVGAIYRTVGRGSEALGALAGGVVATEFGVTAPMLLGVLPMLAAAALFTRTGRGR
jgi:MFS family permease